MNYKVFDLEGIEEIKKDIKTFLSIEGKEYDSFLHIMKNGEALYEMVKYDMIEDYAKEISNVCKLNILESESILNLFYNIIIDYDDNIYEELLNDLKTLGLSHKEINKINLVLFNIEKNKKKYVQLSKDLTLSNETIPSLEEIYLSLDVRYDISKNGELNNFTPVILMSLIDDIGNSFNAQLHIGKIRNMIEKLTLYYIEAKKIDDDKLLER